MGRRAGKIGEEVIEDELLVGVMGDEDTNEIDAPATTCYPL